MPIRRQFFVWTQIRQSANPGQSESIRPIRANPCQSCANRGSIFRSDSNSPICQSWPIRANPCQSGANPVPIGGQFFAPTQIRQSLPIHANPCQSVPIRANPVPIGGQLFVSTQIRQFADVVDWHGIDTGSNSLPSMPIQTNPVPIPGQSDAHLSL